MRDRKICPACCKYPDAMNGRRASLPYLHHHMADKRYRISSPTLIPTGLAHLHTCRRVSSVMLPRQDIDPSLRVLPQVKGRVNSP